MNPHHRQGVAAISQELVIRVITLYKWLKAWRLQSVVDPASQKDPEDWGQATKFTVALEMTEMNATKLSGYRREQDLYPQQVARWRLAPSMPMPSRCR